MHGRLKVKTTAELAEAKRVEREKKSKIFKNAMIQIFHKRQATEYDEEYLQLTEGILASNPDVYTLWNIRREIYDCFMQERSPEQLQTLYMNELQFIATCLRVNPKSYGCWQQRMWVLIKMPFPDWNNELALCNTFLEYDERNFHCWDHRRFVVSKAKISVEQELAFTTKKIATNFSNYSSWHYRSKLLLELHGCNEISEVSSDKESRRCLQVLEEDALLKEFTTVQNAFFTDPDDQSAWFYQRWLLGKGKRGLEIRQVFYICNSGSLMVAFTNHVAMSDNDISISVLIDGVKVDGHWHHPRVGGTSSHYSPVWVFTHDTVVTVSRIEVILELCGAIVCQCEFWVDHSSKDGFLWSASTCDDTQFKMGLTAATNAILTSVLNSCIQLQQLEPQNKWTLLTVVVLMRTLDYSRYELDITSHLKKLEELDPKRCAYYRDLGSRFTTECSLSSNRDAGQIDLAGKQLTALYHLNHMTFYRELNLSNNHLSSTRNFYLLQLVEKLTLDNNHISRLTDFCLPKLSVLSLKNNYIANMTDISQLQDCPCLTSINLEGNPLCSFFTDYRTALISEFPNLIMVDGVTLNR